MRAYYLNPTIDAEGLKKLDAIADKHAQTCKDGISKIMSEFSPDDCPEVQNIRSQMLQLLVSQLILFG